MGGSGRPDDELSLAPQSDGGPGFVDVLASQLGELRHARASEPAAAQTAGHASRPADAPSAVHSFSGPSQRTDAQSQRPSSAKSSPSTTRTSACRPRVRTRHHQRRAAGHLAHNAAADRASRRGCGRGTDESSNARRAQVGLRPPAVGPAHRHRAAPRPAWAAHCTKAPPDHLLPTGRARSHGGDNGPASHAGVCPNPRSPQPFLRRGHLVSELLFDEASPSRLGTGCRGPATRGEHAVEADLGWSAGRTGLRVDTGSDAASIGGALRARGVRALTGPEHFSPFGGMDSYLSLPLWYPGDELERALEDLGDITRSA